MSDTDSSGSDSSSSELLVNRVYICFCEKRFTTYPGVYLHLKSKHGNVFEKYKKLKITKLFKKIEGSPGKQVFKLDKLSQLDQSGSNNPQKKIKDNKNTALPSFPIQDIHLLRSENQQKTPKASSLSPPQPQPFHKHPPASYPPEMSENDHFYQNHPYPGFPHGGPGFGMNSGNFPPYMNYPPPMLPYPKPPIKRMIERFLYESNTDKYILKMVLYRLMVFIDSHYQSLQDPRARDRLFLSYCDQFDPTFIRPLLHRFIDKMRQQKPTTKNQQERAKIQQEIQNVLKFQLWLSSTGLVASDPSYGSLAEKHPGILEVMKGLRTETGCDEAKKQVQTVKDCHEK